MKVSDIHGNHWNHDHKSYDIMNTRTIKEVVYMECHQVGKYSTQIAMSTCPTMRTEVLRSNILVHRLITSHRCISLTDVRSPTDNENGNQGTRVQCKWCE